MKSGPAEIAILQWLATVGAVVAAFSVGYVARNGLGISLQEIRIVAAVAAAAIGALLVIEYFGRKARKPK
jgi:hypothetical protein